MSRAAIAQGILDSKLRGGGVYLNPGKGEVIITKLEIFKAPMAGTVFAANFVVDKCEPFRGLKDEKNNPKPEGNPVGSVAGIACKLEDGDKWKKEYAFEDMTQFLTALTGDSAEEVVKQLDAICGVGADGLTDPKAPQPLRGMRLAYSTKEIQTNPRGAGKEKKLLTKVIFAHVKQTREQIQAEAAKLPTA